jgi:hypothetical protein
MVDSRPFGLIEDGGGRSIPIVLLAITRPVHHHIERYARRSDWNAARAAIVQAIRWVIAVVTAGAAISIVVAIALAPPAAAQPAPMPGVAAIAEPGTIASADLSIPELMARVRLSRALPRWVVRAAERAYEILRGFETSNRIAAIEQRTAEVAREVRAILVLVVEMQADGEAGRQITDREFRLTHDLIEAHFQRLEDLTIRVHALEVKVAELEAEASVARSEKAEQRRELDKARGAIGEITKRVRRPGCGVGRAPRGGKCIDVAENPR